MKKDIRLLTTLNEEEAYAAKGLLIENGIDCKVTNSKTENFIYISSSGFTEYYLQVTKEDSNRANDILSEHGFVLNKN